MKILIYCTQTLLGASLYAGLAIWSITVFAWQESNSCPIWPAAGLAYGLVLAKGQRFLPAIWLGATAGNAWMLPDSAVWIAGLIGMGNMLEAGIGVKIVTSLGQDNRNFRMLICFIVGAALAAGIAAVNGVYWQYVAGLLAAEQLTYTTLTWWAGDFVGILVITPCVWAVLTHEPWAESVWQGVHAVGMLALFVVGAVYIFNSHIFSLAFLTVPFLYVIALIYTRLVSYLSCVLLAGIAVWGTTHGSGPFVSTEYEPNSQLLMLLVYVAVMVSTALLFGEINRQRVYLITYLHQEISSKTAQLQQAKERAEADTAYFQGMLPSLHNLERLLETSRTLNGIDELHASIGSLIQRVQQEEHIEMRG